MEDSCQPLTVEADWPPSSVKSLTAKLQIYFQSKKKSQGGDCVVQFCEQTRTASVLFRSAHTQDQVLAKGDHSITVDNQVVKLKVFVSAGSGSRAEPSRAVAGTTSNEPTSAVQPVKTEQKTSSVRVANISADALTNETLLELYFERWGGEIETLHTIPEEQAAIITFTSPDAVQKILSKTDHSLGNRPITIRPYSEKAGHDLRTGPSSSDSMVEFPQSSSVVLENLPTNFSREVFGLLVENISNLSEEEFFTEFIRESDLAVVTFKDPTVAEKFLFNSKSNKKLQKNNIRSRALEKSKSIKVENLPNHANPELLELFFEKWGGTVEQVSLIQEEQAAIVTFYSEEDVEKILGRDYHIGKTKVKVYPYYQSLGTALYGKDRPTWAMPKPFTEKIHPAVREFLHKKGLIPSISDQMGSLFCQVNIDKCEVKISPLPTLLRQKGITKKQIDDWSQNTADRWRNILSNYGVFEYAVIPSVWSTVEKDIRSVMKDKAFMEMDDEVLTLAGMAQDVKMLKPILEDVLQKASKQMERDKSSISEHMDNISPAMFTLLLLEGLQKMSMAKYPELKFTHKKDKNQLTFIGLSLEIMGIKNWILEKKLNMKTKTLKLDPTLLDFLSSVDCDEMSEDLFTSKGINAVYKVENGGLVLTGSTDAALRDAEKCLQMVLTVSTLPLKDLNVIEKPEWRDLSDQLCDTFNTSKKKTVAIKPSKHGGNIVISGFKQPVSEVSLSLEKFISMHSNIEEVIHVRSHAKMKFIQEKKAQAWQKLVKPGEVKAYFDPKRPLIRLSGERMHVQPAKENFLKIAEALHTDKLILNKAGAKKYFQEQRSVFLMMIKEHRFVVLLEEGHMVEEDEEADYDDNQVEDFGQLSCEVQLPGGIIITVRNANICRFKVDAVVNAANEDLKHVGGVALALLKAAGPRLQDCSDQYVAVHGQVRPGYAITTEAGLLPCKYVVHTVGPRYYSTDKATAVKLLRQAVRESLKQAVDNKCSSIALPVISSGIFGFPLELCTETIAKELRAYTEDQKHQHGTVLTEIHLVDNNTSTVNVMTQAVRKEFADFKPKTSFPQQMRSPVQGNSGHDYRGQGSHGRNDQVQGYRGQDDRRHGYPGAGPRNNEQQVSRRPESSEFETQGSAGRPSFEQFSTPKSGKLETQSTPEGLKIILRKGNIQDESSDVIVNTIAENANLNQGAVSKALLQAAGPQLQSEASAKMGYSKLHAGDILVTNGYNLNSKKVYHTVCPFWNGGAGSEDEVMKKIITDCLKMAENYKLASISFPAVGTGNLRFPRDLVSSIMLRQIHDFSARVNPRHLNEVTVVVHPSDSETIQSFIKNFRGGRSAPMTGGAHAIKQPQSPKKPVVARPVQSSGLFGVVSTPTLGVHTVQVGNVTMEVSSGDITKEKSDAIVNSSNATFSLKSGVSKAILDAAGPSVEAECTQAAGTPGLQQKEMIMTSGGQLPCKHIIHIPGRNKPADIKYIVYSVLKMCEGQKLSSVAFPALGTGQGGASPSAVADAMIDAVVEFVKKKKAAHLRSVKFLIFQGAMVSDFHQSMLKRQQKGAEEDTTIIGWIKDTLTSIFSSSSAEPSSNEDFVMVGEEFEPAVFQLCAESQQDLNEARELVSTFIVKEQMSTPIQDTAINHFTSEDAEMITNLQRELTVRIQLNRNGPEPVIIIEGLTRDVVSAESTIRNMISKVQKNEERKRQAFMFSSLVEWSYVASIDNLVTFDYMTNYELEEAFGQKQRNKRIKIHGEEYEADVYLKVAYGKNRKQIELKRLDLREQNSVPLPSHWDDMTGKGFVTEVEIQPGTKEYTDVEAEFRSTKLNNIILKIERIQNSTLWKSYTIHKKHFEEKNKHNKNEKRLFHGTSADTVDKIKAQGFNRSYAGMHGTMYGNGVYFAVDPHYSAQGYAKVDRQGHKRMFLARVLVGDYTNGKAGMISPPAKSSSVTDLYDSVTDNQQNPSMFVIFHDVQAYPEYLFTFQ